MPTSATSAPKVRVRSQGGVKAPLRRIKGTPVLIRPNDLQARVAETVQRLQHFQQSLEVSGSTYTQKHLQTFSEKLAAIRGQLNHFPKPQEEPHANGQLAAPGSGRIPVRLPLSSAAASPARATPTRLGHLQALVEATGDLRASNGNLSAHAVADAFGVSINQLAGWLGRTRQAVSKTPNADSLQDGLAAFEQVARLRTVLAPDTFRKWLRMPSGQLDGAKPLDLLATGRERPIVARLVEDMLTGMPT